MLSMPQNEKIVKLLAHGHNTYAELHAALPEVEEASWIYAARLGGECPDTSPSVFIRNKGPREDLTDGDTFSLTPSGHSLLHRLEKESGVEAREQRILFYTRAATVLSALGLLVSLLQYLRP